MSLYISHVSFARQRQAQERCAKTKLPTAHSCSSFQSRHTDIENITTFQKTDRAAHQARVLTNSVFLLSCLFSEPLQEDVTFTEKRVIDSQHKGKPA